MESLATMMSRAAIGNIDLSNLKTELDQLSKRVDRLSFIQMVNSLLPKINLMMAPEYSVWLDLPERTDYKVSPNGKYLYIYNRSLRNNINTVLDMQQVLINEIIDKDDVVNTALYQFKPGNILVEFANDDTSAVYFNGQYEYFLLDLLTGISTRIPFLDAYNADNKVKDLIIFESDPNGPSLALWSKGKITLLGKIPDDIFWDLEQKDLTGCHNFVSRLADTSFTTSLLQLFTDELESPYISSSCDWMIARFKKQKDKIRIVKITPTELQTDDLIMTVPPLNIEILPTNDNRFIFHNSNSMYISDFKAGSYRWIPIVKTLSNDDIILEEIHIHQNGFIFKWRRSGSESANPGKPGEYRNGVEILPSSKLLTVYDTETGKDDGPINSNYDLRTGRITFHLANFGSRHTKPIYSEGDVVIYNRRLPAAGPETKTYPVVYDHTGNKIDYQFDVPAAQAGAMLVDTNKTQFRLLYSHFEPPSISEGIEYVNNTNGIYYTESFSQKGKLIYMDRRISFLRKLIDCKQLFANANIPLPAVYPNDLMLIKILKIYNQYPYNELIKAGYNPEIKHMAQRKFEQIVLNLFYPSSYTI